MASKRTTRANRRVTEKIKKFDAKSVKLFRKLSSSGGSNVVPADFASMKFSRRMHGSSVAQALKEMGIKDKQKKRELHKLVQELHDEEIKKMRGETFDQLKIFEVYIRIEDILESRYEEFKKLLSKYTDKNRERHQRYWQR